MTSDDMVFHVTSKLGHVLKNNSWYLGYTLASLLVADRSSRYGAHRVQLVPRNTSNDRFWASDITAVVGLLVVGKQPDASLFIVTCIKDSWIMRHVYNRLVAIYGNSIMYWTTHYKTIFRPYRDQLLYGVQFEFSKLAPKFNSCSLNKAVLKCNSAKII